MGFLMFDIAHVRMKFKINFIIFGKLRYANQIFSYSRNMQHMVKVEHGVRIRVNIYSRTCVSDMGTLSVAELEIIMALIRLFLSKDLGVFGYVVCGTSIRVPEEDGHEGADWLDETQEDEGIDLHESYSGTVSFCIGF